MYLPIWAQLEVFCVALGLIALVVVYMRARQNCSQCITMLVLGSGGHTAELLSFAELLPPACSPRIYIVGSTDNLSVQKAFVIEGKRNREDFSIETSPRAREVGQSYLTSVFSTVVASIAAISLVIRHRPQLVLCNGPGICVPICLVARVVQLCVYNRAGVVFVESICRTNSLSLSGKLLYHLRLAHVIVQWPAVSHLYPRTIYLGLLS